MAVDPYLRSSAHPASAVFALPMTSIRASTYIQSRFYHSPEVLLGMSYTASIDMWSLGCIAIELFLGLPLFHGMSWYNQLTRIVEMLGMPPQSMLNTGKQMAQFFDAYEMWNPHSARSCRRRLTCSPGSEDS
jgi:dual specificity protein kinase YAK1